MIQRNERNQEMLRNQETQNNRETQRCPMCPMPQTSQTSQKILTDETDQTKYLFEEVDIEDVINDAIDKTIDETFDYLESEVGRATKAVLQAKNPVDGYQEAMDLINDAFADIEAPVIISALKATMLRLMKHRVDALMGERQY